MTSPRLKILERQMARRSPDQAPAPTGNSDLGAALEQMIDQAVEQKMAAQQKSSPYVQRLLGQQVNKPSMPTSFEQLPPVPKTRPPLTLESVVSQRDAFGRISKIVTKSLDGHGPTIETLVTQRDENGRIVRTTTTAITERV